MNTDSKKRETEQCTIPVVGRSLFNKIRDRVDELYEQMEKEIPFTQPYNNLSERKGKLLQTLRILEREGLL